MYENNEKVLEIEQICKTYQAKNGEIEALKDITFDVRHGEFVSIVGPSGCGKSTLLSIISGLENCTKGKIIINGKIGYMLQKDNLLSGETYTKMYFWDWKYRKIIMKKVENMWICYLKNMACMNLRINIQINYQVG